MCITQLLRVKFWHSREQSDDVATAIPPVRTETFVIDVQQEGAMLADFTIFPLDQGGSGLSRFMCELVEIIEASGLDHSMHAMGTLVEGPSDKVFEVIRKCHDSMADKCDRVFTAIKIDDRRGAVGLMTKKVESVEEKLGRQVHK